MSFIKKSVAFAVVGFLVSGTATLAQVGGSDVPSGAKKQGEKEQPGSTGMSKGGSGGAMKQGGGSISGGGAGGANGGSSSKAGADGAGK